MGLILTNLFKTIINNKIIGLKCVLISGLQSIADSAIFRHDLMLTNIKYLYLC
jgi:hypothetical protein